MKTNPANKKTGQRSPLSRPPPVVHCENEPEYSTEELCRRAEKVTGVLEHILHEQHPILPSTQGPPPPRASA